MEILQLKGIFRIQNVGTTTLDDQKSSNNSNADADGEEIDAEIISPVKFWFLRSRTELLHKYFKVTNSATAKILIKEM